MSENKGSKIVVEIMTVNDPHLLMNISLHIHP
jgi:hypothetical protein